MKLKCVECERPDGSTVLLINPQAVVYVEYDEETNQTSVVLTTGEKLKLKDELKTFVKFFKHESE